MGEQGAGAGCILLFVHVEVVLALGGDLGEVGDAEDLAFAAEFGQESSDDFGHAAADAGIDFVKNQGADFALGGGLHAQGEADA